MWRQTIKTSSVQLSRRDLPWEPEPRDAVPEQAKIRENWALLGAV